MLSETFEATRRGLRRSVVAGRLQATSELACRVEKGPPLAHQWWAQRLRGTACDTAGGQAVRTVDFFCGSGGLSLGAGQAIGACGLAHVPVAAVDVDTDALAVYSRNFKPALALAANAASVVDYHVEGRGADAVMSYEPELVDGRLEGLAGKVDMVLAGPPCQGHSNLNNHTRRSDPRNMLYLSVAASAIALRTKVLVIENVPEVVVDSTNVVSATAAVLQRAGYHVSSGILSAAELGAAQTRRRHFLVATCTDHVSVSDAAGMLRQPPMTLHEAIGDLVGLRGTSFMDETSVLSAENRARVDFLFDNDVHDLPDEERPNCHKNGHTYPSVYGRMYWDRPAQTITTGFLTPGRGRYIHPAERRAITPREAARIQGFPDTYDFSVDGSSPSKKALSKWIGDAVPCWLGYAATLSALTGYR